MKKIIKKLNRCLLRGNRIVRDDKEIIEVVGFNIRFKEKEVRIIQKDKEVKNIKNLLFINIKNLLFNFYYLPIHTKQLCHLKRLFNNGFNLYSKHFCLHSINPSIEIIQIFFQSKFIINVVAHLRYVDIKYIITNLQVILKFVDMAMKEFGFGDYDKNYGICNFTINIGTFYKEI